MTSARKSVGLIAALVISLSCFHSLNAEDGLIGRVLVSSEPTEAQVYIDRVLKGVTPCVITEVPVGDVRIVVRKAGYEEQTRVVKLQAGEFLKLKFTLKRLKDVGTILVSVKPDGANVYLGHKLKGETPCKIINVKAGTYTVRTRLKGFVPFEARITVAAGVTELIQGNMEPLEGRTPQDSGKPEDGEPDDSKKPESISQTAEEEEKAFAQIKLLMLARRYDDAESFLNEMREKERYKDYRARINRDTIYARKLKKLFETAREGAKESVGQRIELVLRNRIGMKGEIAGFKDDALVFKTALGEQHIDFADLSALQIVRFAGRRLDRTKPETQALFGILYTVEGEYDRAERALMLAAGGGYNIAGLKSFLGTQKAWAEHIKQSKAAKKAEKKKDDEKPERTIDPKKYKVILVDESRSKSIPWQVQLRLRDLGVEVRRSWQVDYTKLDEAGVLAFYDKEHFTKAFSKEEILSIRKFVETGGSLFFVGSFRGYYHPEMIWSDKRVTKGGGKGSTERKRTPFHVLMAAFGVELRYDTIVVREKTRKEKQLPRRLLPVSVAEKRHVINRHVNSLYLEMPASSLRVQRRAVVLVRTGKYGTVYPKSSSKLPIGAAIEFGKGRVFVLSSPLSLTTGPRSRGSKTENDGYTFFLNSLKWVCRFGPKYYGTRKGR